MRPLGNLQNRLEEDNPVSRKYYTLTRNQDDDTIAKGLNPNAEEMG